MAKVVLIGCGNVGMSFAYSLVTGKNKTSELILIDINQKKAEGEAMDLHHAAAYNTNRIKIKAGDYSDCGDANIIVICAGAAQLEGETRRDLVNKNYKVFKSIIGQVNKTDFKGVYLIATNPVDVMSQITQQLSGFPHEKVIGSGTTLDTARLRHLVGEDLRIHPKNVHAYVIGEHGDSSFIPWSNAVIGLNKAEGLLGEAKREKFLHDVRTSAYEIINRKGATYYGIGICLLDIVEAITENSNQIKTVSAYSQAHGVYLGIPSILSKKGIVRTILPQLNETETAMLEISVAAIRDTMDSIQK